MTKRSGASRQEEEISRREKRTKRRHEMGSTSQHMVNPHLTRLFRDANRVKVFNEKFYKREILEYKYVDFDSLVKLYKKQNVDVANYLLSQNWSDFVKIHRPINKTLIRVLISNLDESTMQSWIYTQKRPAQAQIHTEEEERNEEEEEEGGEATQATHPQAPPSPIPTPRTTHTSSQAPDLATKDDITYLQQFLFEQLRLFQATILSTLDKMNSRLQNLEDHILHHPQHSPHPPFPIPDPTDPKGKRPIPPSSLSVHSSPKSSHHSPPSSPHSSHKSKSSSSSSPLATTTRFKLASRKNTTTSAPVLSSNSSDSEATHSAPTSPTKPTSPSKPSSPTPPPQPPPPTTTPSLPTESSPSQATATYRRRKKLAVTRPAPLSHPYLLMPPSSP